MNGGLCIINSTGAGSIQLGAGPCEFNVVSGTLDVHPSVQGTAAITKTGAGELNFLGANTYTGVTTINAGSLYAYNNQALGGTAVNGTAALILNNAHVTNEVLVLNSTNPSGAFQDNLTGDWAGPITLSTNVVIEASSAFGLDGPISGPGGFTKIGSSTLTLLGTNNNTYAGTTTVDAGTLVLARTGGLGRSIPGGLVTNTPATVRLGASWQIYSPTKPVTLANSSILDLNGFKEWDRTTRPDGRANQHRLGAALFGRQCQRQRQLRRAVPNQWQRQSLQRHENHYLRGR